MLFWDRFCGEFASEGFLQDGLFEFFEGGEFLFVDSFEVRNLF